MVQHVKDIADFRGSGVTGRFQKLPELLTQQRTCFGPRCAPQRTAAASSLPVRYLLARSTHEGRGRSNLTISPTYLFLTSLANFKLFEICINLFCKFSKQKTCKYPRSLFPFSEKLSRSPINVHRNQGLIIQYKLAFF